MEIVISSSSDSSAPSSPTESSISNSSAFSFDMESTVHKPRKRTSAEFHATQRYAKHEEHLQLRGISANSVSDGWDGYHRSASWFDTLKRYLQETDVSVLDLSDIGLKTKEVGLVLEFLSDSKVTELNLSDKNLKNEMGSLSKLLGKTKIKKLNVSLCRLTHDDILILMKAVTDMQITEIDISRNEMKCFKDDNGMFVSHLLKSRVSALNLEETWFFSRYEEALTFIEALCDIPLTHLNMKNTILFPEARGSYWLFLDDEEPDTSEPLLSLFSSLKHTSLTHFNMAGNCVGLFSLERLGDSLRESKLVELDLSDCDIDDNGVNSIFEALVGSKVTYLNLASNAFRGLNNLGSFIKKTKIKTLDLCNHWIDRANMFSFPNFLKDSAVVSLKLDNCHLTETIGENLIASLKFSKLVELNLRENWLSAGSLLAFARTIKHTSITHFNFSRNFDVDCEYSTAEALIALGESIPESNLKHVNISRGFYCLRGHQSVFAQFLEAIKSCSITSVDMTFIGFGLEKVGGTLLAPCLVNAIFTHLNLSYIMMGDSFMSLAANLKFSAVTHLNLTKNNINDDGAEKLANCLKETRIMDLDLTLNLITSRGATALALSLKGSKILSLKLDENEIEEEGVEALALHAETTLITTLDVDWNPGSSAITEMVMWKNRIVVRQLISFFKRIAPATADSVLRFEGTANAINIDTFVEECLSFYKTVVTRSSAASVLAREEDIPLSKDQITELLFDKFPKQFAHFVANRIKADLPDQIRILRRTEELGLSTIVKLLLLNRRVYAIDKSQNILHPYVYKLLNKYEIPICNLSSDPQGIERVIRYFNSFADEDGASGCMVCDVTNMLKDINRTSKKRENPASLPPASSLKKSSSKKTGVIVKNRTENDNSKHSFHQTSRSNETPSGETGLTVKKRKEDDTKKRSLPQVSSAREPQHKKIVVAVKKRTENDNSNSLPQASSSKEPPSGETGLTVKKRKEDDNEKHSLPQAFSAREPQREKTVVIVKKRKEDVKKRYNTRSHRT